jgi:predicted transcriptional regulator
MLIAILPKGFKGVEGIFDAYGYLKLLALKHGIYCQFVTEDTFFKKDQLKWSISNIALQIFSKLGGKPWLVKPAKNNCLILGLGSAHEEVEGEIKKFVAYTVCLDSSGDFKYIKPLSSSQNQNEYIRDLALSLEEILRSELDAHYTSFVLHLPSKIKREEIDAIKDVVKKIRNDNSCEVIVVKINTWHRFYGFGNHNTRVPYESSLIQLSQNQFLLWAEGRQHGKEVLHRVSEPLLIDFLESPKSSESKFECLQDILNLTGANWRGFNSKAQPISILYSKLIADFMKEFSHLDECKDFSVLRAESVAPWFL